MDANKEIVLEDFEIAQAFGIAVIAGGVANAKIKRMTLFSSSARLSFVL